MRLYELWHLAAELATVPGDILEVGVWRGGSGCLIASQSARSGSDATVYLCDTFSGVVKAGDPDPIYEGGEHGDTSPALVRALAESMGLDNVEILIGTFPDESGGAVEERRFKLVHSTSTSTRARRTQPPGSGLASWRVGSSSWTTTAVTAWMACNMRWTSSPTSRRVA